MLAPVSVGQRFCLLIPENVVSVEDLEGGSGNDFAGEVPKPSLSLTEGRILPLTSYAILWS